MNDRVKILQFPLAASKGGITQYVLNLWKNINREKVDFDFLTFSPKLDFEEELLEEGCKVYHISCYPEVNERRFIEEYDAILSHGYDVVELHTSYWKNTIMEERAKKCGGCKVIVHAHSTGIAASISPQELKKSKEKHYQIRDRIDEKLADRFWACSQEAAEWLYGSSIPKERIDIISDTIKSNVFKYDKLIRQQKRQELGIEAKYVIGHVGRFEREKNHKFLIDIFHQVHDKLPEAILLLVGDGSYRKVIEKQIVEQGIEDCVILAGKREDVSDYLQAMDIFAFPSLFEGFGLALLEAQCSGLRCIGSINVPQAAFVSDLASRVTLDNPEEWVRILEETAKGYNRKSQETVIRESGYDTQTQIRKLEKMYMEW